MESSRGLRVAEKNPQRLGSDLGGLGRFDCALPHVVGRDYVPAKLILDKYVKECKSAMLFLSHFHLDHIFGLHTLIKLSFNKGLKIFGPKGTRDVLKLIADHPFSIPLKALPFKVEIFELPEQGETLPFQVKCLELLHASLTLGRRLNLDEKIITYCPDTGYCENAVRLAKGADLLIAECSFRPFVQASAGFAILLGNCSGR